MNIEELRAKLGHPGVPNNGNFYALKEIDRTPNKLAIKYPTIKNSKVMYEELTFLEFKMEALKIASGLSKSGFKKGDRIILLFPVSVDLYLTIFACFYLGIVPVFLDVSMGTKKLIQSIRESRASGVISIDKVLKYKLLVKSLWGKKCFSVDKKKRFFVESFSKLKSRKFFTGNEVTLNSENSALITFTSGTTGRPKGANRTIEILLNQKIVSESLWPHGKEEIDMPAFPMIVLQNLGCGVSSVLPAIDFQNFEKMKPELIVNQMIKERVSRFSAQPYFIEKISDYIIDNKIELNWINSLVVGGAVVSKSLCLKIQRAFPSAQCHIVYGSTEAEPIAHTEIKDFINSNGRGLLLGKVIDVLKAKIIEVSDNSKVENEVKQGEIGEIILSGPHVVKEYIDGHPANEILKIKDRIGIIWHRTGDLGYFDTQGNLWLVGRISDRINDGTRLIPCYDLEEEILHRFQVKGAFINQSRTLFVEAESGNQIESNLLEFLSEKDLTHFKITFLKKLPVDQRHFSRIDRAALRSRQTNS